MPRNTSGSAVSSDIGNNCPCSLLTACLNSALDLRALSLWDDRISLATAARIAHRGRKETAKPRKRLILSQRLDLRTASRSLASSSSLEEGAKKNLLLRIL